MRQNWVTKLDWELRNSYVNLLYNQWRAHAKVILSNIFPSPAPSPSGEWTGLALNQWPPQKEVIIQVN